MAFPIAAVVAAAQMGKMGYDMYNQHKTQGEQGMPSGPTPGQLGRNQTSGLLGNLIKAGQIYQNYKTG